MCGLASRDIHPQKDEGKSGRSTLQAQVLGAGATGLGAAGGALARLSFTSVLISSPATRRFDSARSFGLQTVEMFHFCFGKGCFYNC